MASRRLSADAPLFVPRRYNTALTTQPPASGGFGSPPPAYSIHVPVPIPAPTPALGSGSAHDFAVGFCPGYTGGSRSRPQFPANSGVLQPLAQQSTYNTRNSGCGYPPGDMSATPSIPPMTYPSLPDPFYDPEGPHNPQPYPSQCPSQQPQPYYNPTDMNPLPHAPRGPGNIGFENLPPGASTYNPALAGRRRVHYPTVNNGEKAAQYAAEFTQYFGSSLDNLRSMRELAYCCGMSVYGLPDDIMACKTYLKTVYINLFDVVDARRMNGVVAADCVFRSGQMLREYSLCNGKVCPGDSGQGNPLWKFMLKRWFEKDCYEIDGTRRRKK